MTVMAAIRCDGCGESTELEAKAGQTLRSELTLKGWRTSQPGGRDFCRACWSTMCRQSFPVGQRVCWTPIGTKRIMRGTIWKVVAAGSRPAITGSGGFRDHESYVVESISGKHYWPAVALLRVDTEVRG